MKLWSDSWRDGERIPARFAAGRLDAGPRVEFFHWVLADMPAAAGPFAEGAFCRGFTPHGKPGPRVEAAGLTGARHGINDYTGWFAGDPAMAGDYYGYDGPFPPWNDSILHHLSL